MTQHKSKKPLENLDIFVSRLQMAGMDQKMVDLANDSPINPLFYNVVNILKKVKPIPVTWKKAATIMGNRVISIYDAMNFGIGVSARVANEFENVPFSISKLKWAKSKGLLLVAMPPNLTMRKLMAVAGDRISDLVLLPKDMTASMEARSGYFLMYPEWFGTRKTIYPRLIQAETLSNRGKDEVYFSPMKDIKAEVIDPANAKLKSTRRSKRDEVILSAVELACADLLWSRLHGRKLSSRILRCRDVVHPERHLAVGIARDTFKIEIQEIWDFAASDRIGLSIGVYHEL